MNQDILNLYKKAQNGGLNAQEVFWLEGQAASHPCFGMAYMILARHHYRNQSTIKNKALLKAAAYSNNRSLLRSYLEDTLIAPKTKPVPVSEMKPVLEQRDAEAAAKVVSLQKVSEAVQESAVLAEAPASDPSLETIETVATAVVQVPEALASGSNEVESLASAATEEEKEEAIEESPSVEVAVAETSSDKAEAIETTSPDAEVVETPTAEELVRVAQPEEIVAENLNGLPNSRPEKVAAEMPVAAVLTYAGKPGDVNWFLNMRIKLRTDKHKNTPKRLLASIEKNAGNARAASEAVQEVAVKEVVVLETQTPVKQEPKPIEPVKPVLEQQPVVVATETGSAAETEATQTKKKRKNPEKQYEIGAFSSFTFLDGADGEESEDEIDSGITTMESVEFHAAENASGDGEIVFEENDRIIEITVSPEALHKYFNGKFPTDSSPAFGEFQIELDETEYHAAEQTPYQSAQNDGDIQRSDEVSASSGLDFQFLSREEEAPSHDNRKKIEDIIDRFIENEPGITRAKSTGIPQGDLSKQSNNLQIEDWVTETLAKIYEKQGNKGKAIKIYEQLRLRFPEKNDYFVSLIEKLKHISS